MECLKERINREYANKVIERLSEEERRELLALFKSQSPPAWRRKEALLRSWVGLKIKVLASSSTFKGIEGYVAWETRNTFKILTDNKRCKLITIPKKGNKLELFLKGKSVCVSGDELLKHPVERLKRLKPWRISTRC